MKIVIKVYRGVFFVKEVRYFGDFYEDINNIKEPANFKMKLERFVLKYIKVFMNLITFGFLSIGLFSIYNMILNELLLANILQLFGAIGFGIVTRLGFREIRTISQSEQSLLKLRKQLSKNYGISVSKKSLKESLVVKTEILNSECCITDNKLDSVHLDEKVIRYFQLLDREDQVRILKQVSNHLKYQQQLFLLEEDDFELENIPVIRKLKR